MSGNWDNESCEECETLKAENAKLREALQCVVDRYEKCGDDPLTGFGVTTGIYVVCKRALEDSDG